MTFFIKQWPDHTATLMADNGAVLWTFSSVAEARAVCEEWYKVRGEEVDALTDILDDGGMTEEFDGLQELSATCVGVA